MVEDNEINQQVARELLEGAGFLVTIASNGEEAVLAVKEKGFEAVLMDVQMPVMDGYEATRRIRKWEDLWISESPPRTIAESLRIKINERIPIQSLETKIRIPKSKDPIIAMTAHAMTGDREKCLEAGMNDYVSKPIDPEKLFSALVRWIKPGKRVIPDYLVARS